MSINSLESWDRRAAEAATSWDAALWSERGQTMRMRAAVEALNVVAGDHVLDWGCGTGRLVEFLPDGVSYTGLDTSPGMVRRASRTYPGSRFADASQLGSRGDYSHVVSIGPWNLADGWSKEQTRREVERLWRLRPLVMVLSLYAGGDPLCLSYSDSELAAWARRLSDSWVLDHVLPNDVMLVVY